MFKALLVLVYAKSSLVYLTLYVWPVVAARELIKDELVDFNSDKEYKTRVIHITFDEFIKIFNQETAYIGAKPNAFFCLEDEVLMHLITAVFTYTSDPKQTRVMG